MITLKRAKVSVKIKEQVQEILAGHDGSAPKLAIVRMGKNPNNMSYERGAIKKMEAFGLRMQSYVLPADMKDGAFREAFKAINEDEDVNGILLLRPLPEQICEKDIENVIGLRKDLDGISPASIAKVSTGDTGGFTPCTAEAVIEVLKADEIPISGKEVATVGRSMVVGKPLSMLILKENATTTICHTRTTDLPCECRQAEILVATADRTKMLGGDYVGQDTIVIDMGINVDKNGELYGDVGFNTIADKVSMVTPIPGGVGAVTTTVLAEHLTRTTR